MRLGPTQDSVSIGAPPSFSKTASSQAPKPEEAPTSLPKDHRAQHSTAPSLESQNSMTQPNSLQLESPKLGAVTLPDHPVQLTALSPLLQAESNHTQNFLSLFRGAESEAWAQVLTYTPAYHPDKIDVPFPYAGDASGRLEANDTDIIVRGLWARGGFAQARGILENWLSLGERYTALPGTNQLNELGRSGIPKLSSLLLEEAERHQDPEFLKRSYQVIADDHRHNWSDGYFKQSSNGLNRFCDVDYSHDATLAESGGSKNQARFQGDPMPYNPIDLNASLYRTERDLESMARALAEQSQDPSWKAKAAVWGGRAAQRKSLVLEKMWSSERQLFTDLHIAEGRASQVDTLAAFSVLEAGLLNPEDPEEREILKQLVGSLQKFIQTDGQVIWDTDSLTPAPPQDLLGFARGLRRYGYKSQAESLQEAARKALQETSGQVGDGAAILAAKALLSSEALSSDQAAQPEAWLSPEGLSRLRSLAASLGLEDMPQVPVKQAGRLDRRLRQLHPSLLDLSLLKELRSRGLQEVVLGLKLHEETAEIAETMPQKFQSQAPSFQLGPSRVSLDLPQVELSKLDEKAVQIRRNGQTLHLLATETHLILGDRAYPLEQFQKPDLKLPQDILGAFHTAGENPQLEAFFHANREWLKLADGPQSRFEALPDRPGWNKLYQDIGKNWRELTIEPSVVNHDTAVQYFNPAAVPSLGIFKTQFNWDTMFMAKGMQLQGQEETVSGMTDNLLYLLKTSGRVPNAARSVYLNKSQPPFLPSLVRMSEPIRQRMLGEEATDRWVREAYEVMAGDFHNFWREEGSRHVSRIGDRKVSLSRWGGPNHKFAMDESGFDTTSRFYGKTMDLIPPDLNAFLWGYSKDMEAIALRLRDKAQAEGKQKEFLKFSTEGSFWGAEAERIKCDLIDFCWDEQDGMFRDFRFQGEGQGLQREEDALSACVAPLWVGMLDPDKAEEKRMLERSLDNISRFEKAHGLASTAEDYGHPEMQWNGPSGWAPLHMMAIESEVRYGRHDAAARHTQKWLDTLDRLYQKDGVIIERYDMVEGGYPPVQTGRYEETQGGGPGFGWTNATVPWALIEVVGGVRLHRDAGTPTRMDIIPHLPEGLDAAPTRMSFVNPGSKREWELSHHYRTTSDYRFTLEGDFDAIPHLKLLTPPLARGLSPQKGEGCPEFRIKEQASENGLVRYQVEFQELRGEQTIALHWT